MTIEEFSYHVEFGMFVGYDERGNWATSNHIIKATVNPPEAVIFVV
jgi:hypothetical protein